VNEPSTLGYALTYAVTLAVAALIFLGQLVAFAAALVLAAIMTFLARTARVIRRRSRR
jgi:ABC-type proline/glycine betaine transport system permease subunit